MSLGTDIRRTWALAWPVFLVHLVTIGTSTIDTIMVGQSSTDELAYLGVGRVLYWMTVVVAMGMLTGITVYVSRADGAGEREKCGALWRAGVVFALVLSIPATLFMVLAGEPILFAIGEPPEIARQGGEYMAVTAIGVAPQLFLGATFLFLEGITRPRPGMIIMLSLWPANIALNWLLIDGNMGAPALGATGAAIATVMSQVLGAIAAWLYVKHMRGRARYGVDGPWRGAWENGKELRRFGLAPGIASGMEFAGFGSLSLMAGYLSNVVVAAFQAVLMLHALSFALVVGLATAAGVRVGNAVGRRDPHGVRQATATSLILTGLALSPFVAAYLFVPDLAVLPFSDDPEVIAMAVPMILFIAPFIFLDGVQFILVYALRSMGDQIVASILQILALFVVMVVGAWIATFTFGAGSIGLMIGMAAALVAAALMLGLRYVMLSRSYVPAKAA